MKLIGLTGGIGMGKSTAGSLLREWGFPVVDTDILARQVVEPGQRALAEVARVFGADVIGPDGRLLRAKLAGLVFGNPAALKKLEGIVHPRIRELWREQAEVWRAAGERVAVVVIPLLFETAAAASFDRVICVACSAASQFSRLRARGWDAVEIEKRRQSQWPVEKKVELANHVVWTEGSLEIHAEQ